MSHSTVGLLQSLDALRATVLERDVLKADNEAHVARCYAAEARVAELEAAMAEANEIVRRREGLSITDYLESERDDDWNHEVPSRNAASKRGGELLAIFKTAIEHSSHADEEKDHG